MSSRKIADHIRQATVEDYRAGMAGREIAEKYDIGLASVYRIVRAGNIHRGRKFPAHVLDAAVQDYLDSGESVRVVASRHPLSEDTLRVELRAREVTRPSGATTSSTARAAALEDYLAGMTIAAIADKHGFGRSTVSAWIKADGLTPSDRRDRGESPFDYTPGFYRDGLVWRPVKPVRGCAA